VRGSFNGRPDRVAWIIAGCAVAFLAAFAAGCGSSSSGSGNRNTDMLKKVGKPEGELNLVEWPGYVEPAWTKPFEKQTGCTVHGKDAGTSDEMVQLMRTGQYDGVSASGNATARLVDAGNVSPVNVDLVSNYKTIFPDIKDQSYNTFDGVHYGIPEGRGANLLMWNPDDVKPAPDSWSIILDPKEASKYSGKISAYDDPIYIADAAVYLKAHDKSLGITNPYELDQKQFDAAVNLLKQQRANVGEYWSSATKQISSFANGDDTVGATWQYQYFTLKGENKPVATIPAKPHGFLPTEGATGWSDTWMISSEAKHPNCMYLWMNYIVSPKADAQVAEYFGEAPSQSKACDETSDPNFCAKYHAGDPGFWKRVYYWNTPLADCGDDRGEECKDYNDWVSAWTSIKG
jgi:putative spermidine/putrescine transport system substrate-binding protein